LAVNISRQTLKSWHILLAATKLSSDLFEFCWWMQPFYVGVLCCYGSMGPQICFQRGVWLVRWLQEQLVMSELNRIGCLCY